ncbi:SAM-dependent methyltransferase, MidA [hydrothermal vent metagenome]|uniref:SAM-dependent methyltransferase, MidA n=1 Tax=hydrothermal vent metagenome TaxID=652676 RepID=A0A3B0UG46_9ZZZZ
MNEQPDLEGISLGERIRLQIKSEGPMSLSTYMGLCLTHPQKGYYTSSNPIGTKGDFITAPEISQMFGEMLGTWVLLQWNFLGRPKTFTLAELGPGRGTLMADIMRVVAKDPDALKGAKITLLETSQPLKDLQNEALKEYDPIWISEIEELGHFSQILTSQTLTSQPLIIIANEFFDALPIKQYQFQNSNWHERLIGLQGDKLTWGLSPSPLSEEFADSEIHQHLKTPAKENEVFQTSPLSKTTISKLARLLNEHSGSMLIIDYGYETSQTGDSFQAVADHEFCDPLANPGHADLSAHVDFQSLVQTARQTGAQAGMLGDQGDFLQQLGIRQRAEKIIQANPQKEVQIISDLARLIDSDKMGNLFKAMQISSSAKAHPIKAPFEQLENLANQPDISHGFFGREGGCSPAPFDSLNVSKLTKDAPENISQNRQIVANSLGLPLNKLAILHQIHSNKIVVVDEGFDFDSSIKADAMVSKVGGIGLGVLIADCTPILFYDPKNSIIGATHAGWQGAIKGIIANTIKAMENLGADRKEIIAGIGPTIWQENYEVGEQFASDLLEKHPQAEKFIAIPKNRTKKHFDLPGFVRSEIKKAGVIQISQTTQCTYANPQKYFSHRFATHNSAKTGRQIAIIAIK